MKTLIIYDILANVYKFENYKLFEFISFDNDRVLLKLVESSGVETFFNFDTIVYFVEVNEHGNLKPVAKNWKCIKQS